MLVLATSEHSVARGMLLLFVYSLGIGVPFLLTALGVGAFLKYFQKYKRFIRWGEVAAGVLLVVVGVLMFTDRFTALAAFLPFFNRFAV
jgi:cytochrome c-type biogenesis protein